MSVCTFQELKEAFFAHLKSQQEKDGDVKPKKVTGKPKAAQDDPFGSDEDEGVVKGKPLPKSKPKPVVDDPFGSSDEDEELKGKPAKKAAPKRRKKEDDEDEEEDKPKKKAQKKR